jgi:hypothetical protein
MAKSGKAENLLDVLMYYVILDFIGWIKKRIKNIARLSPNQFETHIYADGLTTSSVSLV